jgi:hypothetical protein
VAPSRGILDRSVVIVPVLIDNQYSPIEKGFILTNGYVFGFISSGVIASINST